MRPEGRRPLPPEFVPPLVPCNLAINRCSVPREAATQRILIMRLGAFGDILMGTPLLAALRRAYPDAHLTWLVERNAREAIDANPHVDELILWKSNYWRKALRKGSRLLSPVWAWRARGFRRQLAQKPFDVFISFQPEEWPLLVQDIGAAQSIGVFDTFRQFYGHTRTSPHTRLYDTAYAFPHLPAHRTDQYLLPLDALGLPPAADKQMRMGFTQSDVDLAASFLAQHGVSASERLVVAAPFTTWPSRCWPAARFVAVGDALARQGCRIVLIGSAKERPVVEALAAQMACAPLVAAGSLGFRALAALISQAALVVSGDTGPMHVAAAVGTPFVALFGPTPTTELAPLAGGGMLLRHHVPCGPCSQKVCPNTGDDFMRCMKLISVDEALHAARQTLAAA